MRIITSFKQRIATAVSQTRQNRLQYQPKRHHSQNQGGGKQQQQQQQQQSSQNNQQDDMNERNKKIAYYMGALAIGLFGVSYASVPLYKAFCQMTGFGGTTRRAEESAALTVKPLEGANLISIDFSSNVHSALPWSFKPAQSSVKIVPGETALAFYTVKNNTDYAITGVATYNVYPPKAGLYFNKIQCFCFEEQRLGPHEEIDMPVFFFIDPEIVNDPGMYKVKNISLSYTFFKTGDEKIEEPQFKSKYNKHGVKL